ncbi:MAG: EF-hand domain-containing protein [Steroidobacteraceae bacterium]
MSLALIGVPLAALGGDQMDDRMGHRMDEGALIKHFDKDADGRVSRQESLDAATERANKRFDQLDRNKDGYLTQDELTAARDSMHEMRGKMRERAGEHWKAADKDGDGAISRTEAEAGMPMLWRRFDQFDANKDGKITRDEMPQGKRMDKGTPAKPSE